MVRSALPFLQEKISGYESYGRAGVAELYGEEVKSLRTVAVNTVTTMVFLNRGGKKRSGPFTGWMRGAICKAAVRAWAWPLPVTSPAPMAATSS